MVHPGAGNPNGTVLNALLYHYPPIAEVPRAGIVHRLDKDTTGLMVVAKTIPAQTKLVRDLQKRKITREEQALIYDYENQFINKQLEMQKFSADERTAIIKAMNGQINDLNETQLRKGSGVVAKWLKDEIKLTKIKQKL